MKKLFSLLLVMALPLGVYAQVFTEKDEFDVGDSVNVALYSENETPNSDINGNGFHVLRDSKAGEETVTLIYDGTIEGSPTVYDESNPGENYVATADLNQAEIGRKLNSVMTAEGKKWRVESFGLLSSSDISYLGLQKNAAGNYEIPAKYSFLAPIKHSILPTAEHYNYWTSIEDTTAETTSVYCVEYNEDRTDNEGIWATLVSKDITSINNNSKCAIRPVVVVKKEYILCNNSKKTPEPTPEKNVKTGVTDYIIPLAGVVLIASVAIVFAKKKTVFKSI